MQRMRQSGHIQQVESEELERLRRTTVQTQKELTRALADLEKERQLNADMVPMRDLDALQAEADDLRSQLARHGELSASNMLDRDERINRVLTPRPEWERLNPFGDDTPVTGRTKTVAADLCALVGKHRQEAAEARIAEAQLQEQLTEASALLLPEPEAREPKMVAGSGASLDSSAASADAAAATAESAISIPGIGLTEQVPRYLRWGGAVRMRTFSKRATEQMVRDIWDAKTKHDAQRRQGLALHSFLYEYLKKEAKGSHASVVETGYNLQAALGRYAYDADVELFLKVLNGDISEEVRGDRERMLEGLLEMFKAVDSSCKSDGGLADKASGKTQQGSISRSDLHAALEAFFPAKSEAAMNSTRRALADDQPGEPIDYEALFADDEDFNQGQFIETILDQHLAEIQEYVQGLEDALMRVADKKGTDGHVLLADCREAIQEYDPTKPEAEVDAYLARGARLGALADVPAQIALGKKVHIKELLSRMKTGLLKRSDNYCVDAVLRWTDKTKNAGPIAGLVTTDPAPLA
mmetsp:Transcript_16823/g.55026  ORF Transcript_16823/g.55026 Transcript_16823/m.55026 type:complete len:527 (+) Transcript_16823:123-1703(+)